jgi:hypothetical protein
MVNYWRDGDLIGKTLGIHNIQGCMEQSLGHGGHANYWGDMRVWKSIVELVLPTLRPAEIKDEPINSQLVASE